MHRSLTKRRRVTATFIVMLLVTTLIASLLPEATATPSPVRIDDIIPTSGPVGTPVRVIGEINTTNGLYKIYFDEKEVGSGNATGTAVNTTFTVPLSAEGNHNVTLFDVARDNRSLPVSFIVMTSYYVTAEPARIQEGLNTNITVGVNDAEANATYVFTINVTDPQPKSYTATLTVYTNATGSGFNSTLYYGNFSAGAHTNYVGNYTVAVIAVNETLATGNFTVGLTDKLEYKRTENVSIRGAGYNANETVAVNITNATGASVEGYPKNVTADSGGIVTHSWNIMMNNTPGTYTVTLTNATMGGTVKPVPDVQNFWIERISIDPTSGGWGTTVRVVGEILTVNGSYQILWDGKNVRNGTCEPGTAKVNDTFTVPPSVKGYHNITLRDVNQTTESMPATFEVTTSCYVLAQPARIPEGTPPGPTITVGVRDAEANVTYTFTINVTDPLDWNWTANIPVITDENGLGEKSTNYPSAYTNYVGTYRVTVNTTLANGSFTIGLTDEVEYRVTNKVWIQGSGYVEGEIVTVDITNATGVSVGGYPKNVTAGADRLVGDVWEIPKDADLGNYTVTLSNATTSGTVKQIPDIQNFTVIRIIIYLNTTNKYDKKPLVGVIVNATDPYGRDVVASGKTNKTGLVDFRLDRGNYTFRAFWKDVQVGILENQSVTGETIKYVLQITFNIGCELAHIKIATIDEDGLPIPFIRVTLTSDKTGTLVFITNYTETIALNTFTNTNYTIEAQRYGYLFNRTLIENLTSTRWINITCPTYTLFVHVLDSNGLPLQNVQVGVYEWSSERVTGTKATDASGSVSLGATFGRYKIRVYNYSAELGSTVTLNETTIDLIEDQFFVVIHSKISNLDLSVVVVDYFGQPIPNAVVELEREFEQEYVSIASLTTGSDGKAFLPKIGGNYRISVYVMGKLFETRTLHLDESKVIVFKIDKLAVVGGYLLEITQLIAGISLGILIALFALALIYRRLRLRKVQEEVKKEKSL